MISLLIDRTAYLVCACACARARARARARE